MNTAVIQKGEKKWGGPMTRNTRLRTTLGVEHVAQTRNTWPDQEPAGKPRRSGAKQRSVSERNVSKKVEARVIDFSRAMTPDEQYREELNAITPQGRFGTLQGPVSWVSKSGIRYTLDGDGKLTVKVPEPHPRVIRRAKRVLAQCKRNPEFPHRPYLFFKHDRVRDIPRPVLRRIYYEEGAGG
ncbi:hypothetical protein [Mycobacterium avium]|uniref:hypothetical protein n=1 Tax=Mycobacterium avium TaxID=1764 RepID=UPI001CC4087F|nr:hypothetical protein [Mycobacterium avium]MBZ4514587.1 hypothetical protein [Mycobacterium avium subsp. hominissuis]MBZ4524128.1 hypothetical protein [Mycobacterium avium subsp. hominissuis]MBZ4543898.1 hypothetical protein [Mycobacterium avium subsp. hominissuis]MBZ4553022.1 hypothetical protein [Mycobacterium avium subsp. hominissuis]MBZ4562535.1 hypothetical protein [Mycobacterium avium subsp. hominissuis]